MKKFLVPAFIAISVLANADEIKLSNFLTNTTFGGDTRINYAATDNKISDSQADIVSTRFRLNLNTKLNDNVSVNAQLRLTNGYELGGANTSKDVVTEFLNLNYKVGNHLIQVGRLSPLYSLNSFLLTDGDKDALAYSTKIKNTQLKAGIVFPYDSSNRSSELSDRSKILYGQAIHTLNIGKDTLATDVTGLGVQQDSKNTAKDVTGFILGAKYTHNLEGPVEFIQGKAQIAQSNNSGDTTGFVVGVTLGDNNLKKMGDWKAEVEYKVTEKDNNIANTKNVDNIKIWAQTYVAKNSNVEIEFNKRGTYKGTKTVDSQSLSVSLNHSF